MLAKYNHSSSIAESRSFLTLRWSRQLELFLGFAGLGRAFGFTGPKRPKQASLRRAVSTAYYALFHLLTYECVDLVAQNADAPSRLLMQRWFDHGVMLNVCGIFSANAFSGTLLRLVGKAAPSPDLQLVARAFRELQQARHNADYDMASSWTRLKTKQNIQIARDAFSAWARVRKTNEATIFALAMLDLKRVQTERR